MANGGGASSYYSAASFTGPLHGVAPSSCVVLASCSTSSYGGSFPACSSTSSSGTPLGCSSVTGAAPPAAPPAAASAGHQVVAGGNQHHQHHQHHRWGPPVSFLIHRIIRILESSQAVVRLSQLESQLVRDLQKINIPAARQFDLRGDVELMKALETNERIHFNKYRNELSYINPYEFVTSEEILLQKIRNDKTAAGPATSASGGGRPTPTPPPPPAAAAAGGGGGGGGSTVGSVLADSNAATGAPAAYGNGGLYGLKVSKDLLDGNSEIKTLIRNVIVNNKVRCIRPPSVRDSKVKCLFTAAGGAECNIYDKQKCRECYEGLRGLLLYSLGDEEGEESRKKIDKDIKHLWTGMELPALDKILEEQNVVLQRKWVNPTAEEKRRLVMYKRKQRRMEQKQQLMSSFGGKLRKIQNTHLFTAEKMKMEIMSQQT